MGMHFNDRHRRAVVSASRFLLAVKLAAVSGVTSGMRVPCSLAFVHIVAVRKKVEHSRP